VKTKGSSSHVHSQTTKKKQNGVAGKSSGIRVHFSWTSCLLKQEMKGEKSCSADFKW